MKRWSEVSCEEVLQRSRSSFSFLVSSLSLFSQREAAAAAAAASANQQLPPAPPLCSQKHPKKRGEERNNRNTRKEKNANSKPLTAPQLLMSLLVLVSQPLLPGTAQLSHPLAHRHELGSVDWQSPWPEHGMPL